MERNKKIPLLLLLLALPLLCATKCSGLKDENPTCYTDYNRVITCEWNNTYVSKDADTVCTIRGERVHRIIGYKSSCILKPVDVTRPTLQKCSMVFEDEWTFQSPDVLTMDLSCNPVKHNLSFSFRPYCHIRLNPPPKPVINFTTISWLSQATKYMRIKEYRYQLKWKLENEPWKETPEQVCGWDCTEKLDPDLLIQGERYEACVRVRSTWSDSSTWSDWSPTASWVSPVGRARAKPQPSSHKDVAWSVLAVCAVLFAVLLVHFKTDKTTWNDIVKKIKGPPLPTPEHSFLQNVNFQNFFRPHFTSESFHSLWKPIEIVSVEVTSRVDAVAPTRPETALQKKMRSESSYESSSSNYSNPIYSHVSPPLPPVSLLTAGNLEACDADSPYGPAAAQGEGRNAKQDEVRGKEVGILQLLSKGSNNSENVLVISDYEKVERPQVERVRLQSLDSGVCSGEEVSQESLEADSISVTDCHDEGPEPKEEGNAKTGVIQRLFGGSGGTFGKGSIQVCPNYQRVEKLQADSPELSSLDSGIKSEGEEQLSQEDHLEESLEENLEDIDKITECTKLLLPPPPACSISALSSFTPQPLDFSGVGLSPALPGHILEAIDLMSTSRSMQPSGDGYMPVRQD